ncbi:hypothetical protein F2Q69_00035103 [Brassica cretica]|uniref:Uncharacterized protein n=2 Tax=Brassica cretica TaxID=69181 RepID=A0ABQ7BG77_BRACR|nr:hypothetical protein DY000_02039653 [Brassica cretica]KAF3600527.1 hypothetical protein F2Q69_00035103 [Brassica cretica]
MGKATRFGILESKTKMLITLQPGTAGDALLLFRQRSDQDKVVTKVNFHVNFTRTSRTSYPKLPKEKPNSKGKSMSLKEKLNEHSKQLEQSSEKFSQLESENLNL